MFFSVAVTEPSEGPRKRLDKIKKIRKNVNWFAVNGCAQPAEEAWCGVVKISIQVAYDTRQNHGWVCPIGDKSTSLGVNTVPNPTPLSARCN